MYVTDIFLVFRDISQKPLSEITQTGNEPRYDKPYRRFLIDINLLNYLRYQNYVQYVESTIVDSDVFTIRLY